MLRRRVSALYSTCRMYIIGYSQVVCGYATFVDVGASFLSLFLWNSFWGKNLWNVFNYLWWIGNGCGCLGFLRESINWERLATTLH